MARLFPLKPLVVALSVGFGSTAAAQTIDLVPPQAADYTPINSQPPAEAAETELSLGSTCLACDHETVSSHAAAQPASEVKTSGEEPVPADYTRITADYIEGQNQVRVRAEGDVIVERNQDILNAEWAEYDQAANVVTAGDRYTLSQNGSVVSGDKLTYNLTDGTGTSENVRLIAEHEGRRLQSVSKKATIKGKGLYDLADTKFNTCAPGDASWYIQAKTLSADESTGIGVAEHASLVFGGVPVLYTPWADFPLHGNRKSGLLVPNISTGSDGLELALPYYFNLAPNLDATLTPGLIGDRGVRIGGQLRYLQPQYSGAVEGNWMPHDKKSEHKNRSQIKWNHNHQFTARLSGGVDFNAASDDDYYRDFYGRNDIADNVNLNRQAWLNYQDTAWGGRFNSSLTAQKYQTLANANGYKDEPYAILPRLSADWRRHAGNAQINVSGQITRFDHDSKQSGLRALVYPSIKWDFHNSWGYVRPKVGLHATHYNLDALGTLPSRRYNRVLPIVNIDSGIELERRTALFGRSYLQTLEPRLFYNYIPTKAQNDLPNFDTSENSFSYGQLFRENLFSGNDRINASNSLSTGLQTRLLHPDSGAEQFRAGIGQKFYLKKDSIGLSGDVGRHSRNRSDWTAFARGRVSDTVSLDFDLHYNDNLRRAESYAAGVRYQPEAGKVLSARYKHGRNERMYLQDNGQYRYDRLSQIDLAAQWPIRKNLYAVGRYNYDLTAKKPLEILAGVEYKSDCGCWSVNFAAQRYVNSINSHKNAFFFNLQLKDLSNIGNNPFEQLRLAVPGYRKTNEVNSK